MLLIEMWRAAGCENDVGRECDQFGCIFANLFGAGRPARVDAHIMAVDPAQFPQPAQERRDAGSAFRIVRGGAHEHADTSHLVGLLRARRERPGDGRAAEERYELAAFHSITSSASSRRRARERSAARLSRARGGDFSVCAMLLLIAAIGTTWMACDEGRQAFTPPRGPFSLHPLVALVLGFVSEPPAGPLRDSCRWPGSN